jgi:hypothetical protein
MVEACRSLLQADGLPGDGRRRAVAIALLLWQLSQLVLAFADDFNQ